MQRAGEEFFGLGYFYYLACVHERYPMRHLRDDGQVVCDQQHRHLLRLLELLEQIQNLGLNRNVQRSCGLIGDDHIRFGRQGDSNHHALLLAPRHLERVVMHPAFRLWDTNPF